MAIYYVDSINGSDGNAGTSAALAKATLNAVEDLPVAAGDTVKVRPGSTFRELLTIDVSGSSGNPITYEVDGAPWGDPANGYARITGSDDDIALTRANCITATSRNYRTFRGFLFDGSSSNLVTLITSCSNWIFDKCYFMAYAASGSLLSFAGTGTNNEVKNCFFWGNNSANIIFTHSSTVNDTANLVDNCILIGGSSSITMVRVGGGTIKNCTITGHPTTGIGVSTALAAGQTWNVNNNLLHGAITGMSATTSGEITEDYNNIIMSTTPRNNVTAGAHSLANFTMFDPRWFFQIVNAANSAQLISPFDLDPASLLVNVAGTSPSTTDLRGNTVQGAQREWGALEYDSRLKFKGNMFPLRRMD